MTNLLELQAELRNAAGKAPSKLCRKEGKIPAIIYGHKKKPLAIALDKAELNLATAKIGFMSQPILIKLDNESHQIIPCAIQTHPVTDQIQHIDFLFAEENKPIKVKLALKFINRDKAPAFKKGGKLNIISRNVEVLCKPQDAPSYLTIDLAIFNVGDKFKESHLSLPAGVSLYNVKKDRIILTIIGKNKDSKVEEQAS